MIKLKLLRWRNYSGLSRWAYCKHSGLYKCYGVSQKDKLKSYLQVPYLEIGLLHM